MDPKKIILYAALAVTTYFLMMAWQTDYPTRVAPAVVQTSQSNALMPPINSNTIPTTDTPAATQPIQVVQNEASKQITVQTDVLKLAINLKEGDVVGSQLLAFPASVEEKDKPFTLLQDTARSRYVANSSLVVQEGSTIAPAVVGFTSTSDSYQLSDDKSELVVQLQGRTANGVLVTKQFTFKKGSYLIGVQYHLTNEGTETWKGYFNTQLLRNSPEEDKSSIFHVGSFTGASYSSPGQQNFKKIAFSDMQKNNLEVQAKSGWIAMQQHYFLSAWIAEPNSENTFYTRAQNQDFIIGSVSKPLVLEPNQQKNIEASLYIGPEIADSLRTIAPALDQTVDYGMLWFLSSILFTVMKTINNWVGNWGWSIILVTVLIKLAFYRLSATSYRSMAGMRKLQPKLAELRERYGDDKAKMSQATMELYRQEKLNPLGGCLPILIQIPVFIALYSVLLESVELRQAPFIFWMQDLSAADPYHVLPIIMGITMLIQQKLNPAPPDPIQAKVMMFLPILFTGLFWSFPSGLVLYWIVNNTLSILQQWYITRKYENADADTKKPLLSK
jgi:YidC/Oxa1 family membrane protein insertase